MTTPTLRAPGGVHTLRRVVVLLLLAILVSTAASGAEGLLTRLFTTGAPAEYDTYSLARSLASLIVAAPLGALAYWLTRRWLGGSFNDRRSLLWPVYLAVFGTIALVLATSGILSAAADAVRGDWDPSSLARGLVWSAVWAWHAWMWAAPSHSPSRLVDVGPALGMLVGVCVTVAASTRALSELFAAALVGGDDAILGGEAWWVPILQQLVWVAGGAAVWWWHWVRRGIRTSRAAFSRFALVVVAGFVAVALALGGISGAVYSLAALAFELVGSPAVSWTSEHLRERLSTSTAAAAVGAVLWALHRRTLLVSAPAVRWSARLVASGVALAYAASGLGVVVTAVLGASVDALVSDERSLLLGGVATLTVGGLAWWLLWRPAAAAASTGAAGAEDHDSWAGFAGRRAYLVAVFGASALTAVITLLVIAYGALDAVLQQPWPGNVIVEIRTPLGVLTATVLVAVYHFAVWRRSRPAPPAPSAAPSIRHITLVTGGGADSVLAALRSATGATVEHWMPRHPAPVPDASAVVAALGEVSAAHVLVVATGERIEVTPLAESAGEGG